MTRTRSVTLDRASDTLRALVLALAEHATVEDALLVAAPALAGWHARVGPLGPMLALDPTVARAIGALGNDAVTQFVVALADVAHPASTDPTLDTLAVLHERLLADVQPGVRKTRGMFFTPAPLVRFVLRAAHECLDADVGHATSAPLVLVDPAAGAGTFLAEAQGIAWAGPMRMVGYEVHAATSALLRARFGATVHVRGRSVFDDLEAWGARGETLVVVGNPPFSGHSASDSPSARALVRGVDPRDERSTASYLHVDGSPIGERNSKWTADDCIQFLRWSQWQLERADRGAVALVLSHALLRHPTLRGVRDSLRRHHDGVRVLDLHGNVRGGDTRRADKQDENVFDVQQGVAVVCFWRTGAVERRAARVSLAERWGTREEKLAWLTDTRTTAVPWIAAEASGPWVLRDPRDGALRDEYELGVPVSELMPGCSPAVVTGRDGFLVAFSRSELEERICAARDPALPDGDFAQRFLRTGDRLDLRAAREALRRRNDALAALSMVMYRPFDRRWLLDLDPWIERPRRKVMGEMARGDNFALIARRQAPAGRPTAWVFAARESVVDGVIRSDNYGTESVFPLWIGGAGVGRTPNFSMDGWKRLARGFELAPTQLDARDALGWVYGMLHTPSYTRRHGARLVEGFPRVPWPVTGHAAREVAALGRTLMELHAEGAGAPSEGDAMGDVLGTIKTPHWERGCVRLDGVTVAADVSPEVWGLAVGGFEPARKWWTDRAGRALRTTDLDAYARLLTALGATLRLVHALERVASAATGSPP